jgi:hypothetical protein
MKSTSKVLIAAGIFFLISCGQSKVEEATSSPPAAAPLNETKVTTDGKSTEIKVSNDGGSIDTKNGGKETKIELDKDKAEINIKR